MEMEMNVLGDDGIKLDVDDFLRRKKQDDKR